MGIIATITGPECEVLRAQAERGFAEVLEEAVEKVITDIFEESVPEDVESNDQEMEKRLKAMSLIRPDWQSVEVNRALHKAFLIENPEALADPCACEEVILDYLNSYEQAKFKSINAQVIHVKGLQPERLAHRREAVKRHFKLDPKAKAIGKKKRAPRCAMPDNPTAKAITGILEANAPDCIHYEADMYNGRWRITCDSGAWKSVSWTKRGLETAYSLCLYWAAFLAEDYTGIPCQWDLKSLGEELKDVLVVDDDS